MTGRRARSPENCHNLMLWGGHDRVRDFIAIGSGVAGRRGEAAVAAVRGVRRAAVGARGDSRIIPGSMLLTGIQIPGSGQRELGSTN